ncbi:MAG TPA: hypothetical protein RMH85_14975 [Polyangiaceae bacterium LLY-WYZ-15_(1-7)]|nr:hypothetical protein [Myxococcales bacterium]MAT28227.1 hypothetical protein [Sandaracinus sp.]HJL05949.1 hypothetical protein [Polyangiaceae bacterium LLY-WYZ-15_(1-7)]MBJ75310.1 hypothetical protein [Sandaracinus sp.]HJL09800.1 hypothetical protein [Polyangiaceae bacterium LLY-WYZ-15_(1-7)]
MPSTSSPKAAPRSSESFTLALVRAIHRRSVRRRAGKPPGPMTALLPGSKRAEASRPPPRGAA